MVSKIENQQIGWRAPDEMGWSASIAVIRALVFSFLGCGAIYAAMKIEGTSGVIDKLAIILAVGLSILAWRKWEFGVQALLVIVIVEGAIRKWFLPSYAELVYFYKDALMCAIIVGYLMQRRKPPFIIKRQIKLFSGVVGAFVLYAFAVVSNPRAPHLLASLLGVKAYYLYMPLIFIVPRMFTTKEKLIAFLRWYLIIALAVAAIGVWQFMDGNTGSALNRYAWNEAAGPTSDIAVFADSKGSFYVRVTSTFSFISGLTVYLPTVFALLLGLTSLRSMRTLPPGIRWLYYMAMGATVVTAFMSGSRGVIVNLLIITLVFYAFTSMKDAMHRLRQFAAAAVLVYLALMTVSPRAVEGLYHRAFGGETQIEEGRLRIAEVFSFPSNEAAHAGAFGYGMGATQNGTPALMRRLGLTHAGEQIPIPVESESARVMLELGVIGFLLYTLLRLSILIVLWRACVMIRDREHKTLAVAAFAAMIFPLIAGGAVVVHTQNVYQWFLIGTVFALLNADKLSSRAIAAEESALRQIRPAMRPLPASVGSLE